MTFCNDLKKYWADNLLSTMGCVLLYIISYNLVAWYSTGSIPSYPTHIIVGNILGLIIGYIFMGIVQVYINRKYGLIDD